MKTLISALLGAGALGLLLVAYLAFTGRQEVRQEVSVDKANFEQEATKFDQSFEQKWQAFGENRPTKAKRDPNEALKRDAQTEPQQIPRRLAMTQPANEKDLAEMKATLEAIGKKP
jgi:hypothetical protein